MLEVAVFALDFAEGLARVHGHERRLQLPRADAAVLSRNYQSPCTRDLVTMTTATTRGWVS